MANPLLTKARGHVDRALRAGGGSYNLLTVLDCILGYLEERHEAGSAPQGVPEAVHEHGWQWRPVEGDTAFAPPFGTVRKCRGCDALVAGGVTACARCAEDKGPARGVTGTPDMPVDALDLDALQALCSEATPGPWDGECGDYDCLFAPDGQAVVIMGGYRDAGTHQRNARFVAAARDALPKLIAIVRRLHTALAESNADLDAMLAAARDGREADHA